MYDISAYRTDYKLHDLKHDLCPFNFDWGGTGTKEHKVMEQGRAAIRFYINMGVLHRDYTFQIDRRTTRRGGAHHRGNRTISVSAWLVEANTFDIIEATIKHEIAHGIDYTNFGTQRTRTGKVIRHGNTWKTIAIAIGDDGERCYDSKVVKNNTPTKKFKYTLVTKCCGNRFGRHKLASRLKKGIEAGTVYATCCKHLPTSQRGLTFVQNF